MLADEAGQHSRQVGTYESLADRETDPANAQSLEIRQPGLERRTLGELRPVVVNEELPYFRQADPVRAVLNDRRPDLGLELRNLAADGGSGQAQELGRRAHRAETRSLVL